MISLDLSVIIPAHDEGDRIYKNIEEAISHFNKLDLDYELVVVNDGSKDNTHQEASRASKKFKRVKVVSYHKNMGKGEAIRMGYTFTNGDYICVCDADLDIHPTELKNFKKIMEDTKADVVVGSKRHPKSKVNYPFFRRVLSDYYYFLTRILFNLPVKDTQAGFKLFKTEVCRDVFPRILCKSYAFDLEVLVNANHKGYKIVEAPVDVRRMRFTNRINSKAAFHIFLDTLAIFYRLRILRYYDKVSHSRFFSSIRRKKIDVVNGLKRRRRGAGK